MGTADVGWVMNAIRTPASPAPGCAPGTTVLFAATAVSVPDPDYGDPVDLAPGVISGNGDGQEALVGIISDPEPGATAARPDATQGAAL